MNNYLIPTWPVSKKIKAFTTTRNGGFSSPPFASFNLGEFTDDDAAVVTANRAKLCSDLNLPTEPRWLNQKHTNIVIQLNEDNTNFILNENRLSECGTNRPEQFGNSARRRRASHRSLCGINEGEPGLSESAAFRRQAPFSRMKKAGFLRDTGMYEAQKGELARPQSGKPKCEGYIADAAFTTASNVVCVVQHADCLPILICDQEATIVAAIHAGWRGIAAGIIEATITAMNYDPQKLLVWLGPAIGPQIFEVGAEVREIFIKIDPINNLAFIKHGDKFIANIYLLAKLCLNKLGIPAIYGGEFCTYSEPARFFSYRRDGVQCGRMATLIWIDSDYSVNTKSRQRMPVRYNEPK